MAEPVFTTYQKISKKENKSENKKQKRIKKANFRILLYKSMGFFLAMSIPYGNFAPLGLAFLTMERKLGRGMVLSLFMVCLGSMFLGSKIMAVKYIAANIIYASVLFVLEKGVKISLKTALCAAVVSLFISGMTVMYWQGISSLSISMLALELLITGAGVIVIDKFKRINFFQEDVLNRIKTDEKVALGIVLSLILIGLKNIYIGGVMSLMNIVAAGLILIAGISTNAPVAASCGVIIGMLCGIETDYFLPMIGAFGFCGFLTGVFSKFGKGGSAAGLVLANAVLVVYTNNAIEPMLKIYEIFAAAALFVFVPQKLINNIRFICESNTMSRESIVRMKESIKTKLKSVSESFSEMSLVLEKLSDKENAGEITDIGLMFDSTADKICKNCRKSAICWGKNFNATYRAFFALLEVMENEGEVHKENIGDYFIKHCLSVDKLLDELSKQYDIYNVKKIWKTRLLESRELAGQQLYGVSKIMDDIVLEFDNKNFGFPSGSVIRNALENRGFKIKNIDVLCDSYGKVTIEITIKTVFLKGNGEKKIKNIIDGICLRDMDIKTTFINDGKEAYLIIREKEKFSVEHGIARVSASEKSGDNYRFFKLGCGKYVIALSDGMGTGELASKDSRAIIELLNTFFSAGFDKKVALKLINSIMIMKSENQVFATVDICIIDLYTGEVEFIKTGAEPSYIRNKKGVEIIKASSLPAGIVATAEPETFSKYISDGTTIVMLTDGVESKEIGNRWIKGFIEDAEDDFGAEELAKNILNKAILDFGGQINDDMTVISVKLHRKVS